MNPQLVQERFSRTCRINKEQFVFIVCQQGVETTIKARWLGRNSPFRLAYSRPGLLTLKIDEYSTARGQTQPAIALQSSESPLEQAEPIETAAVETAEIVPEPILEPGSDTERQLSVPEGNSEDESIAISAEDVRVPQDWMIRLSGFALGNVRGDNPSELVESALTLAGLEWDAVHVFDRDAGLPGVNGFEPGPSAFADETVKLFIDRLRAADCSIPVNCHTDYGQRVLDVVLIEPSQWLIGHHTASKLFERWPGGAYAAMPPARMISRAYLKMAEAIAWSELPFEPGDWIVEIGSAPGGACQRMLDQGFRVTGIDPAEMDPLLLTSKRFEHWRGKSSGIRRKMYSKFRWLAADANVAPNYTLDCVEDIVNYRTSQIEGLLLTLKLSSYELVSKMPEYVHRVRGWGFQRVDVRQLASNRRECCLVAQRLHTTK